MPASTSSTKSKRRKSSKGSSSKRAARSGAASGTTTVSPSKIKNYTTATKWLYGLTDHERLRIVRYNEKTFSLKRMEDLLEAMGRPQDDLKCVQVAGSKGKGSTCAMLASMLQACGYTVGLYSSPHMVDLRERITIDGQMISHADMADVLKQVATKAKKLDEPPTYFEALTAAALAYFAEQAVDIVILETGLGGRLDSTTVVTPLVCGITHISHDHMNILGKDLESIAREKAGIFKAGITAVSVQQEPEVEAVLNEAAADTQTPLEVTGNQIDFSYRFEANRELGPHTRVSITTATSRFEHLPVPLRGEHQAHNCGLALSLLDKLKAHGFILPEEKVIEGLAATQLEGRMEQLLAEPRVIADGAHNALSIRALIRALGAHIAYDSLVMIFGCGQDKDVAGMLKEIGLGADKVIFTKAKANPRAMEADDLNRTFNELCGKMSQTADSLEEALKLAGRAVSREDLIVVTGSFYLVGEAKKYFADLLSKRRSSS